MENASKALLIAGGVLLSLMVASLLMLLVNNVRAGGIAADERRISEELARFNSRFEAYNRRLLYGQEVITLVNMAIDNNRNPEQDAIDGNLHFINVEINITNGDFIGYQRTVVRDRHGRQVRGLSNERTTGHSETDRIQGMRDLRGNFHQLFNEAHRYAHRDPGNAGFIQFFRQPVHNPPSRSFCSNSEGSQVSGCACRGSTICVNRPNATYVATVHTYSALSEFRRTTFRLDIIEYHPNGRVSNIRVTERQGAR